MRVIKFRAWDKKNNIMLKWEKDREAIMCAIPWDSGDEWSEQCDVMQYTGFGDCYENDIVKVKGHYSGDYFITERLGIITWQDDGFIINSVIKHDKDYNDFICDLYNFFFNCNGGIIGNTYENPELLIVPPEPIKEKVKTELEIANEEIEKLKKELEDLKNPKVHNNHPSFENDDYEEKSLESFRNLCNNKDFQELMIDIYKEKGRSPKVHSFFDEEFGKELVSTLTKEEVSMINQRIQKEMKGPILDFKKKERESIIEGNKIIIGD